MELKKSAPTILNAANEVAVESFLKREISYLSIPKIVEKTLNKASISNINSIKDVLEIDESARAIAGNMIKNKDF